MSSQEKKKNPTPTRRQPAKTSAPQRTKPAGEEAPAKAKTPRTKPVEKQAPAAPRIPVPAAPRIPVPTAEPLLELKLDPFLASCRDSDVARRRKNGEFTSHIRYEPFLMGTYKPPRKPTLKTFETEFNQIIDHHLTIIPQYRRGERINLETISWFSLSITSVLFDIETLIREYMGCSFPDTPPSDTKPDPDLPLMTRAIDALTEHLEICRKLTKDEPIPAFTSPFPKDEMPMLHAELWDFIRTMLRARLGVYAEPILTFVDWKITPKADTRIDIRKIDWRVRPPVGDLFERYQRSLEPNLRGRRGDGPRGGGSGPKREGGSHSGPNRGSRNESERGGRSASPDRGPRPERPAAQQQPETPHKAETTVKTETSAKTERPHTLTTERPRSAAPRGPRPDNRADARRSSQTDLDLALAAARDAIDQLRNNPQLPEIPLAPVNSFLRRQQHVVIIEAGFETESRGEGPGRCVFVKRTAD